MLYTYFSWLAKMLTHLKTHCISHNLYYTHFMCTYMYMYLGGVSLKSNVQRKIIWYNKLLYALQMLQIIIRRNLVPTITQTIIQIDVLSYDNVLTIKALQNYGSKLSVKKLPVVSYGNNNFVIFSTYNKDVEQMQQYTCTCTCTVRQMYMWT